MKSLVYITLLLTIFSYCSVPIACKEARTQSSTHQLEAQVEDCPLWFFYNTTTNNCECYNQIPDFNGPAGKCIGQRAYIPYGYFVTYSKGELFCSYTAIFYEQDALATYNSSKHEPDFLKLPGNISELNDYVCGSANRRGLLCGECIDGFGPSATWSEMKCSNCTTALARYGVVIFLLSELLPVSILYFIILIFQVNLTSAPMITFILYSNVVFMSINYNMYYSGNLKIFFDILLTFHGVFNLDFFRYAIPPFCLSSKLKIIHIFYLQYISAIFPFILVGFTWVSVELHSCNCKVVVWIWRMLNKLLFEHINVNLNNTKKSVIDTFATFFLLSFAKITFLVLMPLYPVEAFAINTTTLTSSTFYLSALDPSVKLFSKHNIPYVAVSILLFLMVILPPILLIALYPVRAFRALLFKCCRRMDLISIFVEKFHSCYRDGLDGGRDMRSFASLYFITTLICYVFWATSFISSYYLIALSLLASALLVLIIQPHKEKYMSITDALILTNTAVLAVTLDYYDYSYSNSNGYSVWLYMISAAILVTVPPVWLICFVTFKSFRTEIIVLLTVMKEKLVHRCCNLLLKCVRRNEDQYDQEVEDFSTDRMLHPEENIQWGYGSVTY